MGLTGCPETSVTNYNLRGIKSHNSKDLKIKMIVKTIPTHALFIKTLIVLKNQALHMFRPANWPSSGATSVSQHNHVQ
jgi:hypothetical protein